MIMPTTILGGGQVASCCWWRSTLNINTQPIGWFDASRCSPKFWFSNPSFQNLLPSEHWKIKQTMGNTLRSKNVFFRTLHYTLVMMIDHDGNGNWDYNCGSFAEMQKLLKIAEIHFWPKKISTKRWPKMTQYDPK